MNSRPEWASGSATDPRPALLLAISLCITSLGAQQVHEVATVLVENRTAATDDADARIGRLIATARAHAKSPLAELLLQNASGEIGELDDPARAVTALREFLAADAHGLARQAAQRALRALLVEAGDRPAADALDPEQGAAAHFLCVGPFGDDGDHFLSATFAPDLGFPAPGTALRGRFGIITPYSVERRAKQRDVDLRPPSDPRSGCFFALHQVESERAVGAYVEVSCSSAWRMWVDDQLVAEVRRPADRAPRRTFVPVRLRTGVNHVVVKTGLEDQTVLGLRYVDARGTPLPGVRELGTERIAPLGPAVGGDLLQPSRFVDGVDVLARDARDADGHLVPDIAIACALESLRVGDPDRGSAMLFAFDQDGPTDPRLALALAEAWRGCPDLPRDLRDGVIRRLVERAADGMSDNWFAQVSRAESMRAEDRLEDAAHLLLALARDRRAGRSTHARLLTVQRALGDQGGAERTCETWLHEHPRDEDSRLELARLRAERGDRRGAFALLQDGLALAPGQLAISRQVENLAVDLGERNAALAAFANLRADDADSVSARFEKADVLRDLGDLVAARLIEHALESDPDLDPRSLRKLADLAWRDGDEPRAEQLLRRVVELRPSDALAERRTLVRLAGGEEDFPRIARFLSSQPEVERLVHAFVPTARDAASPSTVLIDRMVVEMLPDGGRVEVVQQLRRINDLKGVEANEEATQAANADEVLRLRTIASDGKSYIPQKVKGDFAMPRLEPGAFVDQLWRRHQKLDDGAPWRSPSFYFQSEDEPYEHTELVLILPKGARGEMRTRGITGDPERIELDDGYVALRIARDGVPRLPDERSTPPVADLVPVAAFGEDDSYSGYARLVEAAAPTRARVTPPIRNATAKVIEGLDGDLGRIRAIHAFVHQQIGVEANADATATLLRRQGSRFFLESAMLEAAGIPLRHGAVRSTADEFADDSQPLFLGENTPQVPALEVLPRDGAPLWLFVDTPRFAPLGFIPATRAGAAVLRIDTAAIERLPCDNQRSPGWTARGEFTLADDGDGELDIVLGLADAQGFQFAQQVRDLDRNRRGLVARNLAAQLLQGWTLRAAEIEDPEPGSSFSVHIRALRRGALEPAGDQRVLALPLPRSELFRRLGDQGPRTLPLRINALNVDEWNVLVRTGARWRVSAIPDGLGADTAAVDYVLRYALEEGGLRIERRCAVRPATLPAGKFDEWVHFLRSADRAEDERIGIAAR